MSYSYERRTVERRISNRTTLGYWVPLVLTVTAAAVGIGAWIWSERSDADDSDEDYSSSDAAYARRLEKQRREYAAQDDFEDMSYGRAERSEDISVNVHESSQSETFIGRMSSMVNRAPSPQQVYDGASKRIVAGIGALGRGLRSIQEERDDFVDHERWTEEVESREKDAASAALAGGAVVGAKGAQGKRRTVCIVVSAEEVGFGGGEGAYTIEHASILSHLIGQITPDAAQLLVLIYAPQLAAHPLSKPSRRPSSSGASSYENIDAPLDEGEDAAATLNGGPVYLSLQGQAQSLVSHPTHILPFTTPTGHIHLLRHLAPSLVYMQESLTGSPAEGQVVKQIEGWVGQVVVVVGLEGAGLVDTETEDEAAGKKTRREKWWMDSRRVGLGKGVEIVDGTRVGEDWVKRVESV